MRTTWRRGYETWALSLRNYRLDCRLGDSSDINLYKEALVHFFTGLGLGDVRLPVYRGELLLGTQSVHTHHEGVLFAATAYEHPGNLAKHLYSIAVNTRQRGLQWINLNGSNITIETIKSV